MRPVTPVYQYPIPGADSARFVTHHTAVLWRVTKRLVSLRKLAAQCLGLSGDFGIETWTQGELAVRLRAY